MARDQEPTSIGCSGGLGSDTACQRRRGEGTGDQQIWTRRAEIIDDRNCLGLVAVSTSECFDAVVSRELRRGQQTLSQGGDCGIGAEAVGGLGEVRPRRLDPRWCDVIRSNEIHVSTAIETSGGDGCVRYIRTGGNKGLQWMASCM